MFMMFSCIISLLHYQLVLLYDLWMKWICKPARNWIYWSLTSRWVRNPGKPYDTNPNHACWRAKHWSSQHDPCKYNHVEPQTRSHCPYTPQNPTKTPIGFFYKTLPGGIYVMSSLPGGQIDWKPHLGLGHLCRGKWWEGPLGRLKKQSH